MRGNDICSNESTVVEIVDLRRKELVENRIQYTSMVLGSS